MQLIGKHNLISLKWKEQLLLNAVQNIRTGRTSLIGWARKKRAGKITIQKITNNYQRSIENENEVRARFRLLVKGTEIRFVIAARHESSTFRLLYLKIKSEMCRKSLSRFQAFFWNKCGKLLKSPEVERQATVIFQTVV